MLAKWSRSALCALLVMLGVGLGAGIRPVPAYGASQGGLPDSRIPVIIDDDGSPDGVLALLYFLAHPNYEVVAATVSVGIARPLEFAPNLTRLLTLLGRTDVIVAAGREYPLSGDNSFPSPWRDGAAGFWGIDLPLSEVAVDRRSAADVIVDIVSRSAKPVILFVSGAHTNLAEALRLDPSIVENIDHISIMGGAVYVPGNIHHDWSAYPYEAAEWNIWVDPIAFGEVLASGMELRMAPLDATNLVPWQDLHLHDLGRASGELAEMAYDLFKIMLPLQYVWDVVAGAALEDTGCCTLVSRCINVETRRTLEEGKTSVCSGEANVLLCLDPDPLTVRRNILDTLCNSETTLLDGQRKGGLLVSWREASMYVGQVVTVEGPVVCTGYSDGIAYINLGLCYPDPGRFTVAIPLDSRSVFIEALRQDPLDAVAESTIQVTGTIELYRGNEPIIWLRDPENLAYQGKPDDSTETSPDVPGSTVGSLGQGDGGKTLDDAMQLYEQGIRAYDQVQFRDAIELYEEALVIVRQLGERDEEGLILYSLGDCCRSLPDYQRAIGYYEPALLIRREIGDREGEAWSLKGLGISYRLLSNYQQAIGYYEQALTIFREIGDREGEAWSLDGLGSCYRSLSNCSRAVDCHEQALAIFCAIGNREGEAWSLSNLGRCHQPSRAISYHERALVIFRETGNREGKAISLNCLGDCYFLLSDYQQAINCFEQALAICREIGDRGAEAWGLNGLGKCYLWSRSDFQQAIDCFEQALEICREIGDRGAEAWSLNNLGNCYQLLSDYQRAINYHEQALEICREIGDRAQEAYGLDSLGSCYICLSDYQRAIDSFEQALAVQRVLRDRGGEAVSLNGLGKCYLWARSDFQQAIDCHEQALAIQREIGDRRSEAWSLNQLGECYQSLSDHQRAIDYYDQSLALSADLGTLQLDWISQWGLGRATIMLGDLARAVAHYEAAIEIVEAVRGTVGEEELRQSYFGSVRELYEEYLVLLLLVGRSKETVFVAERLRARTFLDLVAEGPIGPLEKVGEEGIRSGVVEASVIEADLAEVVASLPESTAAIEYFVTEDATYLWLITGGVTDEPIRIEIPLSELREDVLDFRKAIERGTTGLMNPPDEATFTMSRNLYELLIAPVEDRLDGIDHLIIVPSGPLYYLPFSALLDCKDCKGPAFFDGEYLVEHYGISYSPSLTVLKYARALAGNVLPDSLFLALADPAAEEPGLQRLPEAQDEAQAAAGLFDPSEVYVDTAATKEVLLARASSASQLLLSTHGEFNPQNPMFSYLLVSPTADNDDGRLYAHEVFGLNLHADLVTLSACETLLPALEDATAQVRAVRGGGEDEDVELDERLLATLTAGDEIVGLTRAFICAGTPSVLSTLWKVVSEPTKSLMMAFYGYLEEGMSKVRALQRAQLDLMASYQHPRYWAAFELFGDWGEEPLSADASLFKLSPELLDAWSAWQSQDQEPDDEPPRVAVVMTMTERMTVELLAVISGLSEEIAIKGSFGYFVEVDVPVNLLPTLCGLPEVKSVTPPWVTTNFP